MADSMGEINEIFVKSFTHPASSFVAAISAFFVGQKKLTFAVEHASGTLFISNKHVLSKNYCFKCESVYFSVR